MVTRFLSTSKRTVASFMGLTLALGLSFGTLLSLSAGELQAAHSQCSDGLDNDHNGRIDYPQDDGCESLDDDYEGVSTSGNFVTITDDHESVQPGGAVVYVITLKQQRDDARVVNISLNLPHQSNIVSASDGGAVSPDFVRWTNVSVYKNVTRTLQVHANVSPNAQVGQYLVARVATEGAEATDTTLVKEYIAQSTNSFRISVSDGEDFVQPGERVTYTVTVRNDNGQAAVNDVRLNLPYSTYFENASAGSVRDSYTVTWPKVSFDAGEQKTFTATVQIDPVAHDRTSITARASVGSASDTDQTVIKVGGLAYDAITTSITDGLSNASVGQTLTYRIGVTNHDTKNVATNIALSAGLPLYGQFQNASDGGYFDGTNVRWLIMQIAPGETRTVTFSAEIRSDTPDGTILTASAVSDGITGSVSRDTTRVGAGSLSSTEGSVLFNKFSDRSEAFPGGSIRYTLIVRNTLGTVMQGSVISDRYDAAYLSLQTYDHPEALASNRDGAMQWNVPTLQPGEVWQTTYVLSLSQDTPAGLQLSNIATIHGPSITDISLTQTVRTEREGVISDFPQTGGAMDLMLGLMTMVLATGAAGIQKKFLIA